MKPLTAASPHAIIMIGIPGSGKSTFADRFAETFGAPIVSQSKLQREYGIALADAERLRDQIITEYMKTQRTIIIDGGLEVKEKRDEMVRQVVKRGYRPLVVWVQTDTNEAARRATKPYPQGSGLSEDDFDMLLGQFSMPEAREKTVVISGKHTYAAQLRIVLKQLATPDHSQPKVPLTAEQKEKAAKTLAQHRPHNRGTLLR